MFEGRQMICIGSLEAHQSGDRLRRRHFRQSFNFLGSCAESRPLEHLGCCGLVVDQQELDSHLLTARSDEVERMIGARPGTGGGGVEYLRKTLDLPRAFPWLWDFRTILMAPAPA